MSFYITCRVYISTNWIHDKKSCIALSLNKINFGFPFDMFTLFQSQLVGKEYFILYTDLHIEMHYLGTE